MLRTEDMSKVSDSDLMKEGWYRVRISNVKETDDSGNQLLSKTGQEPIVELTLKVQNEGEFFGRSFKDKPSLQPHALFKLKAYYKAVGYAPGPEGHDPAKLLDGEVWVWVSPGQYQGQPVLNIPPYSIRSLQEGAGGPGGKKN
jgi:hypothetical protein